MRRKRQQYDPSRRDFIRQAVCAGVSTASLVSTVWDLRMVNAAIAQSSTVTTDYKAIVCLFLYGGNDANNLVVQTNATDYAAYSSARGPLGPPDTRAPRGGGRPHPPPAGPALRA